MGTSYKGVRVAISGKGKSEQGPKKVRERVMQIYLGKKMPERESSKREAREGCEGIVCYVCLKEEQDAQAVLEKGAGGNERLWEGSPGPW